MEDVTIVCKHRIYDSGAEFGKQDITKDLQFIVKSKFKHWAPLHATYLHMLEQQEQKSPEDIQGKQRDCLQAQLLCHWFTSVTHHNLMCDDGGRRTVLAVWKAKYEIRIANICASKHRDERITG